ncbi:cryptococcal mannosyltransferase 1-domain-containing protein [Diplogelasinospora grovesii]|uniref:Cryptococcal mannosyltransferase 1-domain-containing protein n=1 Tax=Diplogelasinospora grovesii TaxID=303347 RepID=A0AAN6RZG9_9PEZI|nr:cryptococcal mannosyltransferase 1-domain-containing protein [Diplogelasinospora grovesii]
MSRYKFRLAGRLAGFILVALVLYFSFRNQIIRQPLPTWLQEQNSVDALVNGANRDNITAYTKAILDPADMHLPKLKCPLPDLSRYKELKPVNAAKSQTQYFFTMNLRECLPLLPRLIGSMVEAIRFLGLERCAISIVKGNSADGTAEVLAALNPILDKLTGGRMHLVLSSDIDPLAAVAGERFTKLADLRNIALRPMLDEPERYSDATVVFLNDVAICLKDILELVL